jgi:nicotinamidase-related amidase
MNTALVVIDMQKGFMNELTQNLIAKIRSLLHRHLFDYVMFTQFINTRDSSYVTLLGYTELQQSPETDIVSELQPYAQNLFTKHYYTPFTQEFEEFLQKNRITHLYFVGVDTNACVQVGAVDAFSRGYVPFVLADYCASHSGKEYHESALRNLQKLIGTKQVLFGEIVQIG